MRTLEHSDLHSVALSPDRKTLASRSRGNTLKLWEVSAGAVLHTLKDAGPITALSPDGRTLASGRADGTIKLWDVAPGRELRTLEKAALSRMPGLLCDYARNRGSVFETVGRTHGVACRLPIAFCPYRAVTFSRPHSSKACDCPLLAQTPYVCDCATELRRAALRSMCGCVTPIDRTAISSLSTIRVPELD